MKKGITKSFPTHAMLNLRYAHTMRKTLNAPHDYVLAPVQEQTTKTGQMMGEDANQRDGVDETSG